MTIQPPSAEEKLQTLVQELLPEEPAFIHQQLIQFIMSAVHPARNNRIGRAHQDEIKRAVDQLDKTAKALRRARLGLLALNSLGREALSQNMMGLLDHDATVMDELLTADPDMGYTGRLVMVEESMAEFLCHVENTSGALAKRSVSHGPGAPSKDGPRMIAHHCALIFENYLAGAARPSWNDYQSETFGQFYTFVQNIFEVFDIDANPEGMARQAVDLVEKNKFEKRSN